MIDPNQSRFETPSTNQDKNKEDSIVIDDASYIDDLVQDQQDDSTINQEVGSPESGVPTSVTYTQGVLSRLRLFYHESIKPFPKLGVFVCCFVFMNEALQYGFLFPFIGYMIMDFMVQWNPGRYNPISGSISSYSNEVSYFSKFDYGSIGNSTSIDPYKEFDRSEVGIYAGILASSYSMAQFFSSLIIGFLIDKLSKYEIEHSLSEASFRGNTDTDEEKQETVTLFERVKIFILRRRIFLAVSCITLCISQLFFGLTFSFGYCIFIRSLTGFFNGNLTTVKSYVAEITTEKTQTVAFSLLTISWGFGSLFGPSIGGFFSKPVEQYPTLFSKGAMFDALRPLFTRFPYLLPCFGVAMSNLVTALVALVCMKHYPEIQREKSKTEKLIVDENVYTEVEDEEIEMNETEFVEEEEEENVVGVDISTSNSKSSSIEGMKETEPGFIKDLTTIIMNRRVLISCLLGVIGILIEIMLEELIPLWCFLRVKEGGLSFSPKKIGAISTIMGVFYVLHPLFYSSMVTLFGGKLNSTRVGFLIITVMVITPQINLLYKFGEIWVWVGLVVQSFVRSYAMNLIYTGTLILISNSVASNKLGIVNGFSTSVNAIAMTAAPLTAGPLLSLTGSPAYKNMMKRFFGWVPFSLDLNLPFAVLGILGVLSIVSSLLLDKTLDKPYKESHSKES